MSRRGRRPVNLVILGSASLLIGAGDGMIALCFGKLHAVSIVYMMGSPSLVFVVLLKSLFFGDLDLVFIPA